MLHPEWMKHAVLSDVNKNVGGGKVGVREVESE